MSQVNNFKSPQPDASESTAKLVALTCLTMGFYLAYRLGVMRCALRQRFDTEVLSAPLLLSYLIVTGLGLFNKNIALFMAFTARRRSEMEAAQGFDIIASLFFFAAAILLIILSFKAKTILEEKLARPLSGAGTFFFSAFYLNYALRCADASPAAAAAGLHNAAEQLERYAAMLEKGLLTREEFDAKKKALLQN